MNVAQLTPKTKGPEVVAKSSGTCRRCKGRITRGEDYIAKVDGVGWMHALCASEYVRVINEHLEDLDEPAADLPESRRAA